MDLMPINPDFMPLLQGLRPFLGTKGKDLTDVTLNFVNMISSEVGQETLRTMTKTINPQTQSIDDISPTQYAFVLFLILILLILSSTYLLGKSSVKDQNASLDEVVISDDVIS